MIAFVRGVVAAVEEDSVIVELGGGIALSVSVPLHMLQPYPIVGEPIFLYTHLQIREDAWTLYGFSDREQLQVFRLLLNISGVGAKTALAIVDQLSASRFAAVIAAQDSKPLTAVSGVGKKTAERILLELKGKFSTLAVDVSATLEMPMGEELNQDLLAALRQLGYTASESRAFALQAQTALGSSATAEELLREALKLAMKA